MESKEILIPGTKSDITPSWVCQVTGDHAISEDFKVEGDIQEGNGFLSSICRVSYKTSGGQRNSIIVKLLPTNEQWLEFALADASDEREIKFYSTILPDLLEVVPEIKDNICKFYNGTVRPAESGKKKASMLVMEDLTAHGFKMMNFSGEESDKIVNELIIFMARLHFGAFAVEDKKGISLPKLYPFMQGITDDIEWMNQMESLSDSGYEELDDLLQNHLMPESIWESFEKLKPYTKEIVKKINENGRKNPCLIHGDVWPPNLQIHESFPVKVLDWQLMGYRDVSYDLSIMLLTVLPQDKLNVKNMTELLKKYFNEFERLCNNSKLKIERKSWEVFEKFFFTWGLAFAYLVMLPSISCYGKNLAKYANIFRFYVENKLPKFLLRECRM